MLMKRYKEVEKNSVRKASSCRKEVGKNGNKWQRIVI